MGAITLRIDETAHTKLNQLVATKKERRVRTYAAELLEKKIEEEHKKYIKSLLASARGVDGQNNDSLLE